MSADDLIPDRNQAEQFLQLLDPTTRVFTFQTFNDSKGKSSGLPPRIFHGALADHYETLVAANRAGQGVFVTINQTDLSGRKISNITAVRALWQEDDSGHGANSLPLKPSMVVQSSPGKHHRYFLTGIPVPIKKEEFDAMAAALVNQYGSDPNAKDISRVLRVPGFYHQKDTPIQVQLIDTSGPRYPLEELRRVFTHKQVVNAPTVTPPHTDYLDKRILKLSMDAARRTLEDPQLSRHSECYKMGAYLCRDGIQPSETNLSNLLTTFFEHMRKTDTRGDIDPMDWALEFRAVADGFNKAAVEDQWNSNINKLSEPTINQHITTFPAPTINQPGLARPKDYNLIWMKDIEPRTSGQYLIKGVLGGGRLIVIYGESNSGKTFFTLDMCLHIALGLPWRDRQVQSGVVVYVAGEGADSVQNRIAAYKQHVIKDLHADFPLAVMPEAINLLDPNADIGPLIAFLHQIKAEFGEIRLVVVDTLARAMVGGDENSSQDMGQVVAHADRLRDEAGAAVILVHHSGKDSSRGARGSSALRAATDTEIEVSVGIANGTTHHTAKIVKQRDLPGDDKFGFRLDQVVVGQDEDGDNVTSCTLKASDFSPTQQSVQLTGQAGVAYEALQEVLVSDGRSATMEEASVNITLEVGQAVVNLAIWNKKMIDRGLTSTMNEETVRKAINRVRTKLQNQHLIQLYKEFVWIPNQRMPTGLSTPAPPESNILEFACLQ